MRILIGITAIFIFMGANASAQDVSVEPVYRPAPNYPLQCQDVSTLPKESVTVEFDVAEGGETVDVAAVDSSNPCFEEAAVAAVRSWKYEPARTFGKPVRQTGLVTTFTFVLNESTEAEDYDARPLIRLAPEYPDRCFRRADDRETVTLQFDITETGATDDIRVIESTSKCFDAAAKRAVQKWSYRPKIVDGRTVRREGAVVAITFSQGSGAALQSRRHVLKKVERVQKDLRGGESASNLLKRLLDIEAEFGAEFSDLERVQFYYVRAAVRIEAKQYQAALDDLYRISKTGLLGEDATVAVQETIASLEAYLDVGRENLQSDETAETDTQN